MTKKKLIYMKKAAISLLLAYLGCFVGVASESTAAPMTPATASSYSARVDFPTGAFFNGRNFIYVQSTWVRIVIDGVMKEYDITHVERDPWHNYALVLEGGISITIYRNGRTLYYNDTTYSKK